MNILKAQQGSYLLTTLLKRNLGKRHMRSPVGL